MAVDLYCGVGLFTLPLSRIFQKVIGIEANPVATRFARRNLQRAEFGSTQIVTGKVGEWLPANLGKLGPCDFVLLDPPRAGAESVVIKGVLDLRPKEVAYVSCDPAPAPPKLVLWSASGPLGSAVFARPAAEARQAGQALSRGVPLPDSERAFFEARFGEDFSAVRVHASATAGAAALGFDARAFTLGSNIAFAPGEYAPGTAAGRRLLAHELAHVVQQGRSPGPAAHLQRQVAGAAAPPRTDPRVFVAPPWRTNAIGIVQQPASIHRSAYGLIVHANRSSRRLHSQERGARACRGSSAYPCFAAKVRAAETPSI